MTRNRYWFWPLKVISNAWLWFEFDLWSSSKIMPKVNEYPHGVSKYDYFGFKSNWWSALRIILTSQCIFFRMKQILKKIYNIFENFDGHLEIVNFEGHRTFFRMSNSSNRILRKISYKNEYVSIPYRKCSPGTLLSEMAYRLGVKLRQVMS